ncbi:hypothetical protein OROHE_023232 [Orobanche hederae]
MARSLAIAFVLVMLIFSIGMMAEARTCESQSKNFKGVCVSNTNCANVCKNEGQGFTGGHCRGVRRRCFCTKNC